jgi:hypoxanthine phosphoribosyltransferase
VPEDINDGHKVLVVDDIIDSGEALRTMFEDWQSSVCNKLDYNNIYVASLIYNKDQCIVPKYYAMKISRKKVPEWFEFWWEEK